MSTRCLDKVSAKFGTFQDHGNQRYNAEKNLHDLEWKQLRVIQSKWFHESTSKRVKFVLR